MEGIVDFHSHILPGIDDGSQTLEESVAMLRMEADQGIRHVVATPHFYPRYETPETFLDKRNASETALRKVLMQEKDLPRISVGAEVYYFRGISESEFLPQLTLEGGRYILLEMPPAPWPESIFQELEAIWRRRGITPVIAHIDRYIAPFHTYRLPQRLQQLPVLVQANAGFFLEKRTRRMAMKMLRADQIQLLGSDCHNLTSRKPNLGETAAVIRKYLGEDVLKRIRYYQEVFQWEEAIR